MSKEEKTKPYCCRLVVKAGKTTGPEYEIAFNFPRGGTPEEFEEARQAGLEAIDKWLCEKEPVPLGPLDPADLEKLPWKPYKEGHRAAWIFTDIPDAAELAEVIRHSETGKVEIGEFTYRFSGPKEDPVMFISRTPIKPEK